MSNPKNIPAAAGCSSQLQASNDHIQNNQSLTSQMLADGSKRTSKDSLTPNKKIKLTQNKMINSDNNVETNDETLTESSTAQNNVDINNTTPDSKESEQIDLSQVNLFFNILDEKKVSFGTFYNAALKVLTDTLPKSFNMSTDVNDQIQELFDKEKAWRKKYFYLLNNLNDLKAVVNKHTVDLQHNKNACPDIPKRSVGVQKGQSILPNLNSNKDKKNDTNNVVNMTTINNDKKITPNNYKKSTSNKNKKNTSDNNKQRTSGNNKQRTSGNNKQRTSGNNKQSTSGNNKQSTSGNNKQSTSGNNKSTTANNNDAVSNNIYNPSVEQNIFTMGISSDNHSGGQNDTDIIEISDTDSNIGDTGHDDNNVNHHRYEEAASAPILPIVQPPVDTNMEASTSNMTIQQGVSTTQDNNSVIDLTDDPEESAPVVNLSNQYYQVHHFPLAPGQYAIIQKPNLKPTENAQYIATPYPPTNPQLYPYPSTQDPRYIQNSQYVPIQNSQYVPFQNCQIVPIQNSQYIPIQNSQFSQNSENINDVHVQNTQLNNSGEMTVPKRCTKLWHTPVIND